MSHSSNVATTAFTTTKISPPSGDGNGTSLATGAVRDTKGNAYYTWVTVTNNAKGDSFLWVAQSNTNFTTYTTTLIDRSFSAPAKTGAGWDYWGASIQIGVIPKTGSNDRIVVAYNADTSASGVVST
jgi:hypothetical protein